MNNHPSDNKAEQSAAQSAQSAGIDSVQEEDLHLLADRFPLYEDLRGKTIMVTGATGLLGSSAVRALLRIDQQRQLGLQVIGVARDEDKFRNIFGTGEESPKMLLHDFSQPGDLADAPEHCDYILHFASPTASRFFVDHPVETVCTVLNGTETMLRYALSRQSVMVDVSTLEVYGTISDDSHPLTEDCQGYVDPMAPRSSYPLAKRMAENLCKDYQAEYGLKVRVARLAQTFGAGVSRDDGRVFADFARHIVHGENIVLHTTGELSRCYCYTTDAIEALLYILLRGTDGEAYNVANETSYISIIDMARMVCQCFAPQLKPVVELKEGMGYSPTTKLRLCCEKLRKLGWQPHLSLEQMFERLIMSFQEQGA